MPLVFEAYAADMAERVRAFALAVVSETAPGVGAVMQELERSLPDAAVIFVTDVSTPMVEFALSRSP